MGAGGLFSRTPVGAVAVVDPPASQWYARRARITFICVGLGCWAITAALLDVSLALWQAVGLGLVVGFALGLVTALVVRAWPVLRTLWWWSLEITIVAGVVAGVSALARLLPSWWLALAVALVPMAAGLLVRPVRQFVWAWSWCVVDRHRLRLYFTQTLRGAGGSSRPMPLPLILWARPSPAGERVWLWLRAGLSLEDLDGKTPRIAVACVGASQVRVCRARENSSALVRVDVTRRDPLTGEIPSPLALLIPSLNQRTAADPAVPVSPAVPPVGLDLADVPEPPAPEPRGGGRR